MAIGDPVSGRLAHTESYRPASNTEILITAILSTSFTQTTSGRRPRIIYSGANYQEFPFISSTSAWATLSTKFIINNARYLQAGNLASASPIIYSGFIIKE